MKVKHTLIAFVILLCLGGVFYYLTKLPKKPGEHDIPKENLFSFKPDQVEEFTLQEKSKPPATFHKIAAPVEPAKKASGSASKPPSEKKEAAPHWEITSPEGIAADSNQIQTFLGDIAGMQGTPLPTDTAPNWSEYGLDNPEKSYQFKLKDGKTIAFSIGEENPGGYARYARRDDSAPLLLIDNDDDKSLIEKKLFDLRDKRILPVDMDQASRLELHYQLPGGGPSPGEVAKAKQLGLPIKPSRIVMTKQPNGNWQLDEPVLRTDFGATNYLFTTISGGMMQAVEEDKSNSLEKYGLTRPQIRIDVTTPQGTQSLLVGNQIKRGDLELYYAKNTVWPYVFTILRTAYDQLNQDLEAYRNRYLYDFDQENAHSIAIDGPTGQLSFGRRGEDWYMAGSPEKKVDSVKMGNLLNALHSLRISSYPSDAPNRFAAYGLDRPWMTTKVTYGDDKKVETILFARKDKKFYGARKGEPSVYELSPNEPDNLLGKIKDVTAQPAPEAKNTSENAAPAAK
jgi:Domain of unknown function (DUF4340)